MELSALTRTSQAASPSPCGTFLATLNGTRFDLRNLDNLEIFHSFDLISIKRARFLQIEWASLADDLSKSTRVLLADEDSIRVWDVQNTQWSAVIDNGSGGMGKIARVEFGSDQSEVLVFYNFGAVMTVWSLSTERSLEIKNPKSGAGSYGWNRLGKRGTLAVLTRPSVHDVLQLYAAGTYALLKSITLTTVNARGLKWSPNGHWLAVWESPSVGFKVHIYTADGILYRTYTGEDTGDTLAGLGIRSPAWSPNNDYLAVGGFNSTTTLLSTKTFSNSLQLQHMPTIRGCWTTQVWQEQATAHNRTYRTAQQPITLPAAALPADDPKAKLGISTITFNVHGTLLATRDDRMPTTVWIWHPRRKELNTVLIQHSLVRTIKWHPDDPNILLIQCAQDDNILYIWHALNGPQVLDLSAIKLSGKAEARWVHKNLQTESVILLASPLEFMLVYPDGRDSSEHSLLGFDQPGPSILSENDSELDVMRDSVSPNDSNGALMDLDANTLNSMPDDTFQHRKGFGIF